MSHYIYLIYPIRFLEKNEPTYKIGKTTQDVYAYLQAKYSKSSKIIFTSDVINCHRLERDIINIFDKYFVKRTDLGLEYYTGDVHKMKDIISLLILIEKILFDASKELPKIQQFVNAKQLYANNLIHNNLHSINILDIINLSPNNNLSDFNNNNNIDTNNNNNIDTNNNNNNNIDNANGVDINDNNNISKIIIQNTTSTNSTNVNVKADDDLINFYQYLIDKKPTWYKENKNIEFAVIEKAYRKYSGDNTKTKIVMSRQMNGKLFNHIPDNRRSTKKVLVSFDSLKQLV